MMMAERMDFIRDYLAQHKYGNINEMAEIMSVSPATIRRYFKQLEDEGVVASIRGGVMLLSPGTTYEKPYAVKKMRYQEEKRRIALEACKYISSNDSIFLDSSSTVYEMVEGLREIDMLTIATNDVLIASALSPLSGSRVITIGGVLRKGFYTLTGFFAQENVHQLHVDTFFAGIDAITGDGTFMITNPEEVEIKRYLVNNSQRCIVLCDHEKFNCSALFHLWDYSQVTAVITGTELSDELYQKYIDLGMPLIRV